MSRGRASSVMTRVVSVAFVDGLMSIISLLCINANTRRQGRNIYEENNNVMLPFVA